QQSSSKSNKTHTGLTALATIPIKHRRKTNSLHIQPYKTQTDLASLAISPDIAIRPYRNKDVTLTLPDGLTLKDVPWISVNFGHVMVPLTLDYPRPQKVDALPTFNHGVASDKIVVVDAQTFLIPNFYYDGLAPDAFFWAGKGKPDTEGIRVPDENGSLEPLKKYSGKTIVITLPGDLTVFDIDYLGVWCRAFYVDFGHVILPKNLNVPPSLKMLGVAPQTKLNCEVLHDDFGL
ncbi:Protein Skeletor, isoforms B/C, partial [Armadillidium vulgare]